MVAATVLSLDAAFPALRRCLGGTLGWGVSNKRLRNSEFSGGVHIILSSPHKKPGRGWQRVPGSWPPVPSPGWWLAACLGGSMSLLCISSLVIISVMRYRALCNVR